MWASWWRLQRWAGHWACSQHRGRAQLHGRARLAQRRTGNVFAACRGVHQQGRRSPVHCTPPRCQPHCVRPRPPAAAISCARPLAGCLLRRASYNAWTSRDVGVHDVGRGLSCRPAARTRSALAARARQSTQQHTRPPSHPCSLPALTLHQVPSLSSHPDTMAEGKPVRSHRTRRAWHLRVCVVRGIWARRGPGRASGSAAPCRSSCHHRTTLRPQRSRSPVTRARHKASQVP